MDRLGQEMAFALDDWIDGMTPAGARRARWDAVIAPASAEEGIHFLKRRRETAEEKVDRLRAELILATKELYPEVTDWRTVQPEDDGGNTVGLFMLIGHRPKAVVS